MFRIERHSLFGMFRIERLSLFGMFRVERLSLFGMVRIGRRTREYSHMVREKSLSYIFSEDMTRARVWSGIIFHFLCYCIKGSVHIWLVAAAQWLRASNIFRQIC